jgi:predicted double-glycine peptidase
MIKTKTTSNPTDADPDGEISYSYNMIPLTDTVGNVLYDWDVTKKTTYDKYKTYCKSKGYTAISYENQQDFNADNKRTKYRLNGGSYSPTSSYNSGYSYGV